METANLSRKLLSRLPLYLDYLKTLPAQEVYVSATTIAEALGLGHVQVRKDLAKVSREGRCKTGRCREQLIREIQEFLDQYAASTAVLVGLGETGTALLDREDLDLNIVAGFDFHPTAKHSVGGKPIYSIGRLSFFCRCYDVRNSIIAVPKQDAQAVCDALIACGIQSIWNLTAAPLQAPAHVVIHGDLSDTV